VTDAERSVAFSLRDCLSLSAMAVLETARLHLRPLSTSDVDLWVALHADERVNRFVGAYTEEAALAALQRIERQWSERGHGLFAVESRESGGFLGRCGLIYSERTGEVDLGWTLQAEAWGRRYATEAAGAVIAWGFATLDAPYFTATIHAGNAASVRVAERLGFAAQRTDELHGKPVTVYVRARPLSA
jgi:RimJ/RimL family protein N-acetyltransferase